MSDLGTSMTPTTIALYESMISLDTRQQPNQINGLNTVSEHLESRITAVAKVSVVAQWRPTNHLFRYRSHLSAAAVDSPRQAHLLIRRSVRYACQAV